VDCADRPSSMTAQGISGEGGVIGRRWGRDDDLQWGSAAEGGRNAQGSRLTAAGREAEIPIRRGRAAALPGSESAAGAPASREVAIRRASERRCRRRESMLSVVLMPTM
jgi:hypothetical protein